jgi:Holliday junction resolvasome RuvABC endonuclease subunit
MSKLNIVGFDPSLSNWGIAKAVLDLDTMTFEILDLSLICTEVEKDKKTRKQVRQNSQDLDRAQLLVKGMKAACEGSWLAIAEVPVGSQSARAMASYGVCIGVLASCPVPLIQVTPNEVKLAGAGVKTATKEEMIEWAMTKYPNANWMRHKHSAKGKPHKTSPGVMVGAFNKGDPINDNEHLADAVAAIQAGIDTDQFRQLISFMKATPVFSSLVA